MGPPSPLVENELDVGMNPGEIERDELRTTLFEVDFTSSEIDDDK